MELVAQGASLEELKQAPDGDELRLYLNSPLTESGLSSLKQQLEDNGVRLIEEPAQIGNVLILRFQEQKGIGAIPIVITVAGIVVSLVGAVAGWQLFKKTIEKSIVPILLIGAGVALVFVMLRRRSK